MRKRIDFICPHCNNKERVSIFDELDVSSINEVLDRSKFTHTCEKCNQKTVLDYSFKFHGNGYILFYSKNNKIEKNVKRICYDFGDLKEKIMIFEDGLNDILIEYFKHYINKQINKNDELRYDGSDEENIIFYNLDTKDSLGIKKELYDYFLNKFKFEDKNDVEVNSESFIKYMDN